jgi:hypothetical protein
MRPDGAGKFLLYVSNGDGVVNVYRYWQHQLVGELTTLTRPMGECTDKSGHVYVTDYGASNIVEFAHASKTQMRVIDESPFRPYGCAVNPKNGDLAVANYSEKSADSAGNLAVYAKAEGKPTIYTNEGLFHVNACAYDGDGNLLATGFYVSSGYVVYTSFGYLPAKSAKFRQIDLPPPFAHWTGVQDVAWDGKYWTVEVYGSLYQYTIDGTAKLVGTVKHDAGDEQLAFYSPIPNEQATQAVGADSGGWVIYWKYPAGTKTAQISHGLDRPYGVAISVAP